MNVDWVQVIVCVKWDVSGESGKVPFLLSGCVFLCSVWQFLMNLAFLRTAEGMCRFLWSRTHTYCQLCASIQKHSRQEVAIELKFLVRASSVGCPNLLLSFTGLWGMDFCGGVINLVYCKITLNMARFLSLGMFAMSYCSSSRSSMHSQSLQITVLNIYA